MQLYSTVSIEPKSSLETIDWAENSVYNVPRNSGFKIFPCSNCQDGLVRAY